jgi:hypothetical protein
MNLVFGLLLNGVSAICAFAEYVGLGRTGMPSGPGSLHATTIVYVMRSLRLQSKQTGIHLKVSEKVYVCKEET